MNADRDKIAAVSLLFSNEEERMRKLAGGQERFVGTALLWSDRVLLVLLFAAAWFISEGPEATKAWPDATRLLYRALICIAVVAATVSMKWYPPVGTLVNVMGLAVLGFANVANNIWLTLAACLMIGSVVSSAVVAHIRDSRAHKLTDP